MSGIFDQLNHLTFGDDIQPELKDPQAEFDEKAADEEESNLPEGLGVAAGLGSFLKQDRFPDVTFIVGDEKDESKRARIGAHRVILAARSPVFEAILYPAFDQQQKEGELKEIVVKGVKGDSFRALLQGIYSGKAEITPQNISELSQMARKYQIQSLNRECSSFLKTGVTAKNACVWFSKSEPGPGKQAALNYIEDHCSKVIQAPGWEKLTAKDISTIVKSNQLNVEELELWGAILRWLEAEIERNQTVKEKEKEKEKDKDKEKEKEKEKEKNKDKDQPDPEIDMEKYIESQIRKELEKEKKNFILFRR